MNNTNKLPNFPKLQIKLPIRKASRIKTQLLNVKVVTTHSDPKYPHKTKINSMDTSTIFSVDSQNPSDQESTQKATIYSQLTKQ